MKVKMNNSNILNIKNIHLVGIKGVALASLAQCLDDMGVTVTGSDVAEDFVTKEALKQREFQIHVGFDASHIPGSCDLVVYTGAHQGKQNVEVREALQKGIRAISHAEALGELMHGKKGISICGTGGKSSTSAMTAWLLDYAGARPSFSVGVGKVNNFGVSGRYTQIHSEETDEISRSGWFVAEADEYAVDPTDDHRPRFIYQRPNIIVCTNLKYDHPDIYPTFEAMKQTFLQFFNTLPANGALIYNGDDQELVNVVKESQGDFERISVGSGDNCDLLIQNIVTNDHRTSFALEKIGNFVLSVPGELNVRNSAYAFAVAKLIGLPHDKITAAMEKFTGTMRRFEYKGKINDVSCYDDYAHTPDEIRATIAALREWEPGKKIIVAFQPHTYSRTKALFDGFVESLSLADEVILLDIFASAREQVDPSMSSAMLAKLLPNTRHLTSNVDELAAKIPEILKPDTVFMTMGAGDIYSVYEKLL
jgi:UDP-N-acetylmuramate--alanine ligase